MTSNSTSLYIMTTIFLFVVSSATAQCPPGTGGGKNFQNFSFKDVNFTTYPPNDLVGANFSNSLFEGAQFQNVNLTNAVFTGCTFKPSANGVTDLSGAILDHTCFLGAQLDSVNLQYATFKATDFTNATLFASDFGPMMTIQPSPDSLRTKFVNTITDYNHFPISSWPAAYWSYTDLTGSAISGLNSQNFSFKNKDISWAILDSLDFTNFDFTNCTLTGASLSATTLNYANMTGCKLDRAKLVSAKMNHVQLYKASFYNQAFTGRSADLSGVTMNDADLTACNFSYANMRGAILTGSTADSCNFNNANFESGDSYNVATLNGTTLSHSSFIAAHLNGVNISNAYIVNGDFSGKLTLLGTNFSYSTMPGANFDQAMLQGVLFTGAILQQAHFTNTTMMKPPGGGSGVDLSCSQLGGADFTNATVLQANFSDAVMPVADSCCKKLDGYYCGTIAINQLVYNEVKLPDLKNPVTCPNGENAICSGKQWVVPNWRSSNCNPEHTSQRLWYRPDCGGGDTSGAISFPDPNLKQSLINQLSGGNPGFVITKTVAARVVSLDCSYSNINNPEGLEYFTQLEKLNLTGNKLTDGSFFNKLQTLQTLKIAGNQLTQLNLLGLKAIDVLDASDNWLTSVSLDADAYLDYLDLSNNKLQQLDVSYQTSLNYLDMSHNKLTDVGGDLSGLTAVSALYLNNNSLKTIGNMATLYNKGNGNLHYLNLSCNFPFDCTTLGLDGSKQEQDFKSHSLCGVNNLPDCSSPAVQSPLKKNHNDKQKGAKK